MENNRIKLVGEYISTKYSLELIICQIHVKRWTYLWSNVDEIVNSQRIVLNSEIGIIIPSKISKDIVNAIISDAEIAKL